MMKETGVSFLRNLVENCDNKKKLEQKEHCFLNISICNLEFGQHN